ncbi:MAG: hypothetical protein IKY97_06200 [Mailhella sp.]|nr:hypothetical protein [Mailhella sp.]
MSQDVFSLLNREIPQISDFDFPTPYDVLIKGGAHKADSLPGIVAAKIRSSEGQAKINLDKAMELIADPAKDLAPQALDESNEATHEVTESGIVGKQGTAADSTEVTQLSAPAGNAPDAPSGGGSPDLPGLAVSVEELRQELNRIFSEISGILFERPSPSVVEMKAQIDQLDAVITALCNAEESFAAPLIADALTMQTYLNTAIVSRTHCEERLAQLEDHLASELSHKEKFEKLLDVYSRDICRTGRVHTAALQDILSGRVELQDQATAMLRMGVGIVGTDLQAFELRLSQAMASELRAMLPQENPASQKMLTALCRLSFVSGADPRAMLEILEKAPAWTNQDHMTALIDVMGKACASTMLSPEGESTPAQRAEVMRFVDMLFQGAKFEASLEVIEMKKLLLPGHEAEVELQDACMLASSHLFNHVLDSASGAAPNVDVKRGAALRSATEGVSSQSLLLTPDLVDKLHKKVNIEEFNYHMAHVALLQKKAAQAGLIPASPVALNAMNSMEGWCSSLGLSKAVARYAGELDEAFAQEGDDAKRLLLELQGASRQFVRGFAGKAERDAASAMISTRSGMTDISTHAKYEGRMYESSDDFIARKALDLHIANLSALEGEDRFAENGQGFQLDGEAVDRSIFLNIQQAMEKQVGNWTNAILMSSELETLKNLEQELEQRAATQKSAAKRLAVFKANRLGMESIEEASQLVDSIRSAGLALRAEHKSQLDALESIRPSWLHQHPERKRVGATVLRIAELNSELRQIEENIAGGAQGEELAIWHQRSEELEHDIAALIDSLKGVHPTRLVHSSRLEGQAPSLEVILGQMLPRAKAMSYFNDKNVLVKGKLVTQAKADLLQTKEMHAQLKAQQKVIDKGFKVMVKVLGSPLEKRISAAVSAAVLKTFCEFQHTTQSFNIHEQGVREQIDRQLAAWGLDTGKTFISLFVGKNLRSMTTADGRLDMERLRADVKKQDMAIAMEERKEQASIDGRGRLRAWHRAKSEVNAMLASNERQRWEGIHSLLQEASVPGCGFVYDTSRGLVIDTGTVFSPLSGDKSPLTKLNITNPLSLRFQALHDNSLTVTRGPNGTFSVLLKGGASAAIGATAKLSSGRLMASGTASGGGSNIHGVALSFSNQSDTEAFLREFMKPASDLNLFEDSRTWQTAADVRFIEGYSVSGSLGGGFSVTAFTQKLADRQTMGGSTSVSSLTASQGFNISGTLDIGHTSTKNVHGETVTFTRKWKASASASASVGLIQAKVDSAGSIGKKTLSSIPKLTPKAASSIDFEDRWDLVIEENGISEKTKLETSCPANRVSHGFLRLLLLPRELRAAIEENPAFYDEFHALVRDLPPTARLVVERKLKESVLKEVRQLFVQARMAPDTEKESLIDKAHKLLADKASYRSARLSIRNVAPQDISRNWSPGLGIVQYKRSSGFGIITRSDAVEIPLPPAADDGSDD